MQTQEAILERIKERTKEDFFGFETSDYVGGLTFENAKPFLKDEVTFDQWKPEYTTRDEVIAKILDYMPFAWDKANGKRGLSANRSLSHMIAWIWLAGDNEFAAKVDSEFDNNYEFYGKNILAMICDFYGWDASLWDDGEREHD